MNCKKCDDTGIDLQGRDTLTDKDGNPIPGGWERPCGCGQLLNIYRAAVASHRVDASLLQAEIARLKGRLWRARTDIQVMRALEGRCGKQRSITGQTGSGS